MGNLKSKQATTLNGLYPDCEWTPRNIRAMVQHGRVAPLFRGENEEKRMSLKSIEPKQYQEDCPICFLFYRGGLNRTKCCNKAICTECFLQVKPPERKVPCPFCNQDSLFVKFSGPLSRAQIIEIEQERLNQEAVAARLLNEARKGSSARQLSPEDLGNAMLDPVVVAAERREPQTSASGDVDTTRLMMDAEAELSAISDDDDAEQANDAAADANQNASAPVSIATRLASDNDELAASPRAHFFGSPDHVPAHLDDENVSLMTLEQRMLDEAIRMSLEANGSAGQARSAPASVNSTPANRLTGKSAKSKTKTRSRLSLSVRLSSSADESEKSADSDNDDESHELQIDGNNADDAGNHNVFVQGKDQQEQEQQEQPEQQQQEQEQQEQEQQEQQKQQQFQLQKMKKSFAKKNSAGHVRVHSGRRRNHARSKSTSISVEESTEGSYSGMGDPARRSTTLSSPPCSSTTSCNMSDPEDDDDRPPIDRPPIKPNMTSSSSSASGSKHSKRRRSRKSSSPKKASINLVDV